MSAGKRGRQIEDKAIVVVAAEKSGRGIGRIRLRRVADVSADSLTSFVQTAAVPGSTVNTDGWSGYARLPMLGYRHQVRVISAGSDPAHVVMPRVHKVVSLLRRWLMGTHQGGIQRQHLDYSSMNSRSASIVDAQRPADCSSIASPNRPLPWDRRRTIRSSQPTIQPQP